MDFVEGAPSSTVDIPEFLKSFPKLSTSDSSANLDSLPNGAKVVATESLARKTSSSHYTLADMLKRSDVTSRWEDGRVVNEYRRIIRDIIEVLFQLELKDIRSGYLNDDDIVIIHGRAKIPYFAKPCIETKLSSYRQEFKSLVSRMLGENAAIVELVHFYGTIDHLGMTFNDLWYHPLLQSSNERYFSPLDAWLHLQYERRLTWRNMYQNVANNDIDINTIVGKSNYKAFKSVLLKKTKKEGAYKNNALGVFDYSRYILENVNKNVDKDNERISTKHEVEEELTSLFPTRLIDLYEFLYSMGISMDSLGLRRYTTTQSTFYSIN
ncbi:uncharacterized protein LOC109946986 isoform X1 [Prunus persica]|uniref:uncharacterized protein LOC109946986 isoform X1 n=1 Tax=Prunus persica TaxID=3760 RepID=UPI0009AB4ED1|nr:uncharacterized protein LOC109946986 isoform X1 [Prunus persica]XP_020411715.1 uncharacterized protein LOC109946986 isoform X1 [Prunus persica]XP_020411716.1 uncharacterized protein LOC109946986 isoform X1 [Prunus persica]